MSIYDVRLTFDLRVEKSGIAPVQIDMTITAIDFKEALGRAVASEQASDPWVAKLVLTGWWVRNAETFEEWYHWGFKGEEAGHV
jgi:hypothetical protein